MGNSYFLFTEVKKDDRWQCINAYHKVGDKLKLAMTLESGSRSSFSECWNKLREQSENIMSFHTGFFSDSKEDAGKNAALLAKSNLSDTLVEYFCKSVPMELLIVSESSVRSVMPQGFRHEHRGYYRKDDVFLFESGEIDELYTPDELEGVAAKDIDMNVYQFYEWDSPWGWYRYFKDILEHIRWQKKTWSDVQYLDTEMETRIVAAIY